MKKLLFVLTLSAALSAKASISGTDTIPGAFSSPMQWRVGVELSPAYVAPTNSFLTGDNIYAHPVHAAMSASLRTDFCFNPKSEKGMLYHGLYQGIGVDTRTFFSSRLLGTPVSAYVYQARHSNISATGSGSVTNGDSALLSVGATEAETEMPVSLTRQSLQE